MHIHTGLCVFHCIKMDKNLPTYYPIHGITLDQLKSSPTLIKTSIKLSKVNNQTNSLYCAQTKARIIVRIKVQLARKELVHVPNQYLGSILIFIMIFGLTIDCISGYLFELPILNTYAYQLPFWYHCFISVPIFVNGPSAYFDHKIFNALCFFGAFGKK